MTSILSRSSKSFAALIRACFIIGTTPRYLWMCLIPWFFGIGIWIAAFFALAELRDTVLHSFYPYSDFYGDVFQSLYVPIALFLSGVLALPFVFIINEFTTEWLIIALLKEHVLEGETPPGRSFLGALWDLMLRLLIIIPFSIIVFLVGLIPVLGVAALIPSAFIFGLTLYDYPLCVLNLSFKERLRRAFRNWQSVTSLGALFSVSLLIPGGSILLLPLGYAAAVLILADLPRNDLKAIIYQRQ